MKSYKDIYDGLPPEDQKVLQGYTDQRITAALKKAAEHVEILPNATARLQAIEEASNKKISELEMKNKVILACFSKGISYDSVERLEIKFTNDADIEKKLNLMKNDIEKKAVNDFQKLIVQNSFRPGSGMSRDSENYYGLTKQQWDALSFEEQVFHSKNHRN
jgi:hypothetical protein